MKVSALLGLLATWVLAFGCASQPPPAQPRSVERQPPTVEPRRPEGLPEATPRVVVDLLDTMVPEPAQAGKNPVTPLDTDLGGRGRVTCADVCKRVFGDCLVETIMASGKISPKQIENLRKSGAIDKIRAMVQKTCRTQCRDPRAKGYAKIQAAKRCVRESKCTAVGACAMKYLK